MTNRKIKEIVKHIETIRSQVGRDLQPFREALQRFGRRQSELARPFQQLRAHSLLDLRSPPGNRLEALKGDLAGLHNIRINEQWRLVFRWEEAASHDVRIIDYH